MARALVWPASKGLPLPGTLTLLKPLPSVPLPASCHDQARPPPPLTWRAALSPVSTIHFPRDCQPFLKCGSPERAVGAVPKVKSQCVIHCVTGYCFCRLVCPHPSHFLSQLFWLCGLDCSLCPKTCIYPKLCPAWAFLPDALSGGLGTHLGLPSHIPVTRLSPIWQFLREGGNPSLA